MILAQFELEWYHAAGASVLATGYGIARIWTTVRKQRMDEKREDAQTEFFKRTADAAEESGKHLAAMNVKLDHVCKADCRNFERKT